jgi:RimJ/RimL family protein N-acetyltransferase
MSADVQTRDAYEDSPFELSPMTDADALALLTFARALDPHDLLFVPRDIRQPKVVGAWLREIEAGHLETLLAVREGVVIGCGTLVRDPLSWSAHVAEIRVVLAQGVRGLGLGRRLVGEMFSRALERGATKVLAQMTVDQHGAIAVFERLGFQQEAVLRAHVRDQAGVAHDLVTLSYLADVGTESDER